MKTVVALCYALRTASSGVQIAEFVQSGRNDGVIHWRSSHSGPLLPQIIESLGHLHLSEEKMRQLFDLGSLYQEKNRLINWQWLLETHPAQTYLRIHTEPRRYQLGNIDWQSRLLFQNEDFLIFNKPSQIPCHPMVDNTEENLLVGLEKYLGQKVFITHRLDTPTEGLLLFAKTTNYQSLFNQLLIQRKVHKKYYAQTCGEPSWEPGQVLIHHMMPSPRAPKVLAREAIEKYQECRLRILSRESNILTLELLTGRTHQIRAQLGFENYPIVGDTAYGANSEPWGPDSIALQSFELEFNDPLTDRKWSFSTARTDKLQMPRDARSMAEMAYLSIQVRAHLALT